MTTRWNAIAAALLALAGAQASAQTRTYDPDDADQFQWPKLPDVMPAGTEQRQAWAQVLATDAAVYGGLAVAQYWQLYAQAVDRTDPDFTGFNRLQHSRVLATPGYRAFKTPNADTLYSNAWLDLTQGPVLVDVPPTDGRYFTFNLLDVYGNASNIGARIQGTGGGRYLIATTDWQGVVPSGATLFRVTTPYMWVLLRIVARSTDDVTAVNALQDRFTITPPALYAQPQPGGFPNGKARDAIGYFRILDWILRVNGHPAQESALVYRWHGLGIAGAKSLDAALADAPIRAGLEGGYAQAKRIIDDSVQQAGLHLDHWRSPYDAGRMGMNYLERTGLMIATGANVADENYAFVTYVDGDGEPLDGAKHVYEVVGTAPPAKFFWSFTPYLRSNRELIPNAAAKYIINDRTPGLVRAKDGTMRIVLSATRPAGVPLANWLPVSKEPFVLAIRSYGPTAPLLEGRWTPRPIRKIADVPAR